MKKLLIGIALLASSVIAHAATPIEEAKDLMNQQKYEEAVSVLEAQYKKNPKNVSVNELLGKCMYCLENYSEAKKYLNFAFSKGNAESAKYLAMIAFDQYDFHDAEDKIARHKTLLAKARKSPDAEAEQIADRISLASAMLDHVEKITIIDSLAVDRSTFFKAFRLTPESGSLSALDGESNTVVFMPESGDRKMWAEQDSGKMVIKEAVRLLDGNWDDSQTLQGGVNTDADSNYPFMMADGTTLYYASNGNGSIGGYDIFMTRKDSDSGEYLQPQNVGMPYNSPYDDYLLAFDEVNGVGWWATDRNLYEDQITVYVFIIPSMRENYDIEDPNLAQYAAVRRFKDTWKEGENYDSKLQEIAKTEMNVEKKKRDFVFAAGPGKVYYSLSDFKSSDQRTKMQNYLKSAEKVTKIEAQLHDLRAQYNNGNTSLQDKILSLEKDLLSAERDATNAANSVRRLIGIE